MNFNQVNIIDIETPRASFLLSVFQVETKTWVDFLINNKQNDLYKMIKWFEVNKDIPQITWNGLAFDNQVIEWIWRNYEKWYSLSGKEIAFLINQRANDVIETIDYGNFHEYRESDLSFKAIDLFKIFHGDNKNRMSSMSLKCMEYYLDMDVETFDFSLNQEEFTQEELDYLIFYCHQDCKATYEMYLLTIGNTDNPVYKDNNQIQIRLDIMEEYGIPCMNYSNSKIGDEIIKLFYCKEKGIEYKILPRKGTFRKEIQLKYCIPSYVSFKTEQLQKLLKEIKGKTLLQDEEYKNKFKFFNETYVLARGGLHTASENKYYHSDEEYVLLDADVSGYYVVTSIKRGYYPYHLGKEFLKAYEVVYNERMRLKPESKTNKRIKGVVQGLKEGGVSVYGKSSDKDSWLHDKLMTLQICITGELSLLMLIEDMELAGIECIMANSDGITVKCKRKDINRFYELCNNWCKMTNYELEYTEFKSLWFSNVNNYIGLKSDSSVKQKGDSFLVWNEVFKDKSFRIIPLALEAYFIKDIKPEEFLASHTNIFDFCSRGKVNRNFFIKTINRETGEEVKYNKLIRYYVSNEGVKLYKIKREECQTNAAKVSEINAGIWKSTIVNKLPKEEEQYHLSRVNRSFYLTKIQEVIFKIEKGRVAKKNKINNPLQQSLF